MVTLLVDDLKEIRDLIQMGLESLYPEMVFLHAENGVEAIEIIEKFGPRLSLVVCDFNMPGGNGDLVAKKWDEELFHVPFVMLTSEVDRAKKRILNEMKIQKEKLFFFEKNGSIEPALDSFKELISQSFFKVPLYYFQDNRELNYPLYIALSDKKFVHYAHAGDTVNIEKFRAMEEKGAKAFLVPLGPLLKKKQPWPLIDLHDFAKDGPLRPNEMFNHFENLYKGILVHHFIDEKIFLNTTTLLKRDIEGLMEGDTFKWIKGFDFGAKNYVTHHSFLLGLIGTMIICEIGIDNPSNRQSFLEACLIHDIFKTDEVAIEHDLVVSQLNSGDLSNDWISLQRIFKNKRISPDFDIILETLYFHRVSSEKQRSNHKLAKVARVSHEIVSTLYRNSFIKKDNLDPSSFESDPNIIQALDMIFV